jgi:citrate synthase
MTRETEGLAKLILAAKQKAIEETGTEPEPGLTQRIQWPVDCTVGPGLEGAIACESSVGYVNGSKGWLIYRGYDIFDLCAYSTFEEVCYLLLHGDLPTASQLAEFKATLAVYRNAPRTIRRMVSFPLERMHMMALLRMATNLMRQEFTKLDRRISRPDVDEAIGADEDSIPMETKPTGEAHAIYEFERSVSGRAMKMKERGEPVGILRTGYEGSDIECCYHLIGASATLVASMARIRAGGMPLEPDPKLGHAANFLYMLTGKRPSPPEERIMDIALILHADHGMNASTFATMVVASTLSDIYFSVGSGIGALSGPLHGGANEKVVETIRKIGSVENVKPWYEAARTQKRKIAGFGHRVYKSYDPRARILAPLAESLAEGNPETVRLLEIARALEREVVSTLGEEKKIFPNVDFYSGLVFTALGIPTDLFVPIFAISRVAGWTARVLEYLQNNRIFRPRAMYVGEFGRKYAPLDER